MRWKQNKTTVYNLGYHIIFCPKYRRKVLKGQIEKRLKELIIEKAAAIKVEIAKMEVMPDHVHLFIKGQPVQSPQQIVAQIKGYTSHFLRKEFSELRTKLPTLWTRSYYVESVGHISEKTILKYIENQKERLPNGKKNSSNG